MFYIQFWLKAFDYKSSANRLTFVLILLFNIFIGAILTAYDFYAYSIDGRYHGFMTLYNLACFIPWLALSARRLNSMKASRAWIAVQFIPVFGAIMNVVLVFYPGKGLVEGS